MKVQNKQNERLLYNAVLLLKTHHDCKLFLDDILSPAERNAIIQRLQIAELLSRGMAYREISEITQASTTTISRVMKSLQYGTGGLSSVLERLS